MKRNAHPTVIRLPNCPVGEWLRPRPLRTALALSGGIVALAGCTTFATNIKGSFACGAAGEGTCAPASVIDDRALAEITGDASYIPAGPYRSAPQDLPAPIAAGSPQRVASAGEAVPTGQKVLRIVFPAHVDGGGRYHDTSIVRAVVDNGSWMKASATYSVPLASTVNLTVNPDILAQLDNAVQSDPPRQLSVLDPNLPSTDAVAAARARGAAPASKETAPASVATPAAADPKITQTSEAVNRPASFNPQVEN